MPAVTLHKTLPEEWKPTAARVVKIERFLVLHSGRCLSWNNNRRGQRDVRLTFRKRKFSVRGLLYLWKTGETNAPAVKSACGNSWCIRPSHQVCKIASG